MEVTTIINLPNCAINKQYITVPLVVQPTEMKEMEAVDAMLQTFVCFFLQDLKIRPIGFFPLCNRGQMTWCQV